MKTGMLTYGRQHDWVWVSLNANQAYEFTITGLSDFAFVELGTADGLAGAGAFAVPSTSAGRGSPATQYKYFMPAASGTYHLDLSDSDGAKPESSVGVVTTTADFTDNPTGPGALAIGSSVTGSLTNIGQHDWVAVSLTANQAYEFTITGLSEFAFVELGTADGLAGVGTGAFAVSSTSAGLGSPATQYMYFMPAASGTYYLDLSDSYGVTPESYSVSVVTTTADFTDNPTQPGSLAVGGSVTGSLTNIGEHDWVAVSLTANQAYEFTITGLSDFALVELGTADGLAGVGTGALAVSTTSAGLGAAATQYMYFMPAASGTYYLDLSDSYGVTPESYSVSVVTTTADFTDNPTQPGSLAVGGSVTGSLTNIGEHDWVAVSLTANQAYEFTITGLSEFAFVELGTADGLAGIGTGAFAVSSSSAGLGSPATQYMYFMPAASGTYYIDLSDSYGVTPESYSVSVVTTTADFTDNPTGPGSLVVGGSVTGSLTNIGEHDWVAVSLTANQAYEFTITGLSEFAFVELGTADGLAGVGTGAFAVSSTSAGLGSPTTQYMYFMPAASGTYYLDLSDSYGVTPESYSVSVVTTTADFTDNPTGPGSLAVGGSVTGSLTNIGEHDWVAVSLTANQAYEFTITGLSEFAFVELGTADGLAGVGAGAFAVSGSSAGLGSPATQYMYFMPAASGTYYLDLSDSYGITPESYSVSVVTTTADFTDNPTGPGWVVPDGSLPSGAASDFNNDGNSDLLWQNGSGEADIWELNGITVIGSGSLGNPGPDWHIKSTGEFNGDGKADILWQNSSGEAYIWELDGTSVIGGGSLGNPGPSWHVIGTGDFNKDGHADILWQNSSGEAYVWELNGASVIGSGSLGNPGPSWHAIGTGDFNNDGYSDILWQNSSGEVDIWELNGTAVIGSGSLGNPGPSWHAVTTGDFNNDGYSDILWQNDSGEVYVWELNGTSVIGSGSLGNPGPSWRVVGSGDHNGDGYSDIRFQNSSGEVYIWELNGTNVIGGGSLGNPGPSWHLEADSSPWRAGDADLLWQSDVTAGILFQNDNGEAYIWQTDGTAQTGSSSLGNPGPAWHIEATGDFYGDGNPGLLWQNDNGEAYIWRTDGSTVTGGGSLGNPGPTWRVASTGDFNADGKSDILWQNDSGEVYVWQLDGATVAGGGSLGNPGPSWQARGTGDFNHDGDADILWQNDNGEAYVWEVKGASVTGGGSLGNPGPDWHVKGTGNFFGNGRSDILWQNDNGEAYIWEMNGTTQIGGGSLGNPGPDWHIMGTGDYNSDGRSDILWQNTSGAVNVWEMNGTTVLAGNTLGNPGPTWHA